MACNCATNEQIAELYKKYGEKSSRKDKKAKNILLKIGVGACMVLITPFLFLYVFYKAFDDDKRISVKKFFNIKEKQLGSNVG